MTNNNHPAKFAFFYLLSLASLVALALASGAVIFQIINKHFSESSNIYSGRFSPDAIKFAISALVIAAPIYFLSMKRIAKSLFSGELPADSGTRKWLTYFVMFAASLVMLGWLIAVINNFLNGELTAKFALKALTVFIIAGMVFYYYFLDMKRERTEGERDRRMAAIAWTALVFAAACFVSSLFYIESPAATRKRKYDEETLGRFIQIDGAVSSYYQKNKKLPADFAAMEKEFLVSEKDYLPVSGAKIEYQPVSDDGYQLCAEFLASNREEEDYQRRYDYYGKVMVHDAGWQCLDRKVNIGLKDTLLAD